MKQSRLKSIWFFGTCLVGITIYALFKDAFGVAVISSGSVAGIVAYYLKMETERKSLN